jgi:SAM-dependent methyltransferase
LFPNDDEENDRLDLYHHIQTLSLGGKLHLAPIGENPQRILDIGTGTGIWAIDMGDKYPSAEVLGNDISPIQPSLVPPNVKFEVDDIENEWVYAQPFDYIHSRYLACALRDWPRLMQQMYKYGLSMDVDPEPV